MVSEVELETACAVLRLVVVVALQVIRLVEHKMQIATFMTPHYAPQKTAPIVVHNSPTPIVMKMDRQIR